MQGEGLGYLLQRERNGHDPPTDGDEEVRSGTCERLVGGDGAEQALRREVDHQSRRHEAKGGHGFSDGNALRLHADRPVGNDPGGAAFSADRRVLELPERLRLNFFSILVVTGPKIADKNAICHHSPSSAAASNARARRSGATLMRQARLDQTDRRILRELQADGRITNVELARKVGISAPPCLRRVRALEEAGFIRGYAALLDDRALGFDVTAFAMVGLHSQAEVDLVAFEQRVRGSPIVRDCYMLSGEIDFMLKCVAPDLTAFQDFIIHELTAAPNVASVKTSLVIRASKHDPGVPIEAMPANGKTARAGERART